MTTNSDLPAFPHLHELLKHGAGYVADSRGGLTKREYAAIKMMPLAHADCVAGLIKESQLQVMFGGRGGVTRQEIVSRLATQYADAVLAELARTP